MTCQTTISPTIADQPMCKWQIEHSNMKISRGEIKPAKSSSNQISFIAEEITKLCDIETRQNDKPLSLKFDFTTERNEGKKINTTDFFRLYGLLSVKLNPLAIQISAPITIFFKLL